MALARAVLFLALAFLFVSNVRSQSPMWGTERALSATGGDTWGTGIAQAGPVVHVVYGTGVVYYRRSLDNGTTWESQRQIDSNGVLHLTDPLVADGNDVWAIFLKDTFTFNDWCCGREVLFPLPDCYQKTGGNIYLIHSGDKGVTWDAPRKLINNARAFRVSIAYASNRLHITWMDYRSGAWDTYYLRSPDRGATWNNETIIAVSNGTFGAERPQIAARGDSVHVTIWDDRDPRNPSCVVASVPPRTFTPCPDVFHIRSVDGGLTWGTEINVGLGGSNFPGRNDIAVTGTNNVVINYNRNDPTDVVGQRMYVRSSTDNGATWGSEVPVSNSSGSSDHGSIFGSGNFVHLVWFANYNPGNNEIWFSGSFDAGVTWTGVEQVSSGAAGDSSTPLNVADTNFLHVIWIDNRGGNYQVWYNRRTLSTQGPMSSSTSSSSPIPISPSILLSIFSPSSEPSPNPLTSSPLGPTTTASPSSSMAAQSPSVTMTSANSQSPSIVTSGNVPSPSMTTSVNTPPTSGVLVLPSWIPLVLLLVAFISS